MIFHDKMEWFELPSKQVVVFLVPMTDYQKRIYDEVSKLNTSDVHHLKKLVASHPQMYDKFVHSLGSSGLS